MTDAWVLNASPIILYSRIVRLDLIERLAPGVIVPHTVVEEVRAGLSKDKAAADAVAWASRFRHPDIPVPDKVIRWDLGPGESQVIGHCLAGPRVALMDDLMGRQHSIRINEQGLLRLASGRRPRCGDRRGSLRGNNGNPGPEEWNAPGAPG